MLWCVYEAFNLQKCVFSLCQVDCRGEVLFPVWFLPLDYLCLPRHQCWASFRLTQHHWGGEKRWLCPVWSHPAACFVLPPFNSKGKHENFPIRAFSLVFLSLIFNFNVQCHGLWDNKEVEMPDFFKKLKKKVDKKKMTGADKIGSAEKPRRRLKFLPLQASTTSIFCRQKTGCSSESFGKNAETLPLLSSLFLFWVDFFSIYNLHG